MEMRELLDVQFHRTDAMSLLCCDVTAYNAQYTILQYVICMYWYCMDAIVRSIASVRCVGSTENTFSIGRKSTVLVSKASTRLYVSSNSNEWKRIPCGAMALCGMWVFDEMETDRYSKGTNKERVEHEFPGCFSLVDNV